MQQQKQALVILILSILVGILFAIFSPLGSSEAVFRTLATVQGSFLAIVVSVFILSQQVTASEYTPVALHEMRDDPAVDGLILLFISSILLDIWYHLGIQIEFLTLDTALNIEMGFAVGLATLCLLLLIPTRRHVIEAVGPENVLNSTVDGIDLEAFPSEENSGLDSPPERNPLLAIDQVLQSAKKRSDEFTIRRAIYEMHRATKVGIASNGNGMQGVDKEGLFEYWDNCIEIAIEGNPKRGEIAARGLRQVTIELINENMTDHVAGRLDDLNQLFTGLYDQNNLTIGVLDEFCVIAKEAAQQRKSKIYPGLVNYHYKQLEHIVEQYDGSENNRPSDKFLYRIVFDSLRVLIVSSNLGFNQSQLSDSSDSSRLEELVKRQTEMHEMLLDNFSVDDAKIGDIADQLAVISSASEGANNRDASHIAFTYLVDASLYLDDDVSNIQTRLSDANLSESRQQEIAQSKLKQKRGLKPENAFSDASEDDYRDIYRSMAQRERQGHPYYFTPRQEN